MTSTYTKVFVVCVVAVLAATILVALWLIPVHSNDAVIQSDQDGTIVLSVLGGHPPEPYNITFYSNDPSFTCIGAVVWYQYNIFGQLSVMRPVECSPP